MIRIKALLPVLAAGFLFAAPGLFSQDLPDGKKLLAEVDDIRFPAVYFSRIHMLTVSPNEADKTMTIESYSKRNYGSFMEIQDPPKSKGTRFLNKDSSLWMFSPKSGSTKPIRLASRDSFQGSAFSNSDVSKTYFSEDYAGTTEGIETIDHPELGKVEVYRLRCDATRPEAAYGKIIMWLRVRDLLPLKFDYYAKSGLLYRKMVLSQYKIMAGRLRASHMEMESMDKIGTKSIIDIQRMENRDSLPDSLFNLNNLAR